MRIINYINDNWLYSTDFKEEYINDIISENSNFISVELPHTNVELPYNYFDDKEYQFVSCYIKKLNISSEYKENKIYLDFEGVMIACDIYLNGHYITSNKGGYNQFSADISDYIEFDKINNLVVKVDSTEREDIPPYGNVVDYLTYGGIYREVSLRIVDKIHIENTYIKGLDILEEIKKLETTVELSNFMKEENLKVRVELLNESDVLYTVDKDIELKKGSSKEILLIDEISDIELWDTENPRLYTVRTTLIKDDKIIDIYESKFGFRECKFTPNGFYLNGNLIKLIGLNRHQSYPYVGYAMPERVQKKDADILKYDLGLNIVRTSHYPQSRHFLDRCDEIGLLVFEEIPGWQHIGNHKWQEIAMRDIEYMIKRDYNRPSIVIWGVRINESRDDHEFYTNTNELAHKLDTTRQTGGVRFTHKSEFLEDVFTLNDFVHNGGKKVLITQEEATGLKEKVPYLVTESNGHMYPTKSFDNEEKSVEHANRHLRVINETLGSDEISGSISWCAFDYNTHSAFGSGDKICYHGVMDMFRNKKYAAYSYSSQKDADNEIVLEPITVASRGERNGGGIIPFTIMTNCDYIEIFKNDEFIDTYYPDKNQYPNLKHPSITVYHLLTSNIDLAISQEDKDEIKRFVVNKIKQGNLVELTLEDYKFYGEIAERSGVSMATILGVVFKLSAGWGTEANMLTIKGYKDGKEVKSKLIGESKCRDKIDVIADDKVLSLDKSSYDATRITVKVLDNLGELLRYNNEFVEVEIIGPIKIMGPSKFAINSGITSFWVRTLDEKGEATIKVKGMYFEKEIKIEVQ